MSIFVSYSRIDLTFVRRLHGALVARQRETWVDWEGIPPTADWMRQIEAAIDAADAVVFVISPDSVLSAVCADELAMAQRGNKRLIPILWRTTETANIPAPLARLNWVMFRAEDDFENALQSLLDALDTDLDWVQAHTRLLVRAREWEGRRHEASLTLRGADLKAAEEWLMLGPTRQPPPNELQTRYVIESRQIATRRRLIVMGATAIAGLVIVALGLLWTVQRNETQRQEANALARRLASTAERQRDREPDGSEAVEPVQVGLQLLSQALRQQASFGLQSLEVDIETRRALQIAGQREQRLDASGGLRGDWVSDVAFGPDGQVVGTSKLPAFETWSIARGESVSAFAERRNVNQIELSADGRYAAARDFADGSATVFDTSTGQPVRDFHYPGESTSSIAIATGGRHLALTLSSRVDGNEHYRTLLLDAPDGPGAELREIEGLPPLHWPVFSPDGRHLAAAVGAFDALELQVWSLERLAQGDTVPAARLGRVLMPKFSPEGRHIAAVTDTEPGSIIIWAIDGWKETARLPRAGLVALGPGARWVAVHGAGAELVTHIISANDNVERARLYSPVQRAPVAFSADGRRVAVGGNGGIDLWLTDGLDSAASRFKEAPNATALAFDAETDTLAVLEHVPDANADRLRLHSIDVLTGRLVRPPVTFDRLGENLPATISSDGRTLAYVSGDEILRIDVRSGLPRGPVRRHAGTATLALSADGQALAAATPAGMLRLWPDPSSTEPTVIELGGTVEPGYLAIAPDGARVVAVTAAPVSRIGQALSLQVRDPSSALPAPAMPLGRMGSGLAATLCGIGPRGRLVAINTASSALRVHDLLAGRDVALVNEAGGAQRCVFSADERWLAVTGVGDTVRVWDLAAQAEVVRLEHLADVTALAFNHAARYLATLQGDGTVTVWMMQAQDLLARVCERVEHDLVAADWERFFGQLPYRPACGKPGPTTRVGNNGESPASVPR